MKIDFNSVINILKTLDGDQFLYDLNDEITRRKVLYQTRNVVDELFPDSDVTIACDENINTPELIDKHCLRFTINSGGITATVTMEPPEEPGLGRFVWKIEIDPPVTIISGLTC